MVIRANYIAAAVSVARKAIFGMLILYSDFTVSRDVLPGKKAIGVVFDENRRLAVSLSNFYAKWQDDMIDGKSKSLIDIPTLQNISAETSAKNDFNGQSNSNAVYQYVYVTAPNKDVNCAPFYSAHNYKVTEADAEKWYLPSLGELILLQKNRDAVNLTLKKIRGVALVDTGSTSYNTRYWSSTEHSKDYAWFVHMPSGEVNYTWKYASSTLYRPIIKY